VGLTPRSDADEAPNKAKGFGNAVGKGKIFAIRPGQLQIRHRRERRATGKAASAANRRQASSAPKGDHTPVKVGLAAMPAPFSFREADSLHPIATPERRARGGLSHFRPNPSTKCPVAGMSRAGDFR
jgi:hypothetical protein